ncbi:hypothetical protein Bca4012_025913 [Brassica carinata]
MDHIKFKECMLTRQSILDHTTVQLAPLAADELWYGEDQKHWIMQGKSILMKGALQRENLENIRSSSSISRQCGQRIKLP